VTASVDEEAVGAAVRQLGWRVYATNQPAEQLSLEQAVLAYRSAYLIEQDFGRLKGRPLSLTPMYLERDDHATGLIRLLSIGLRVLTRLACVVRQRLAAAHTGLAGLYAGHPTDLPPIIFGDGMTKQEVLSIPDLKCRHVNRQRLFQSKRELWHYSMPVYRDGSQSQCSTRHSLA
jgi:hypothetical protein